MADEKPKKPRKTTTTAPRKRSGSRSADRPAPTDAGSTPLEADTTETPMLAIEQVAQGDGRSDDVDEIRREAYGLYLSRGGGDGSDLSDWLEAERIVRLRRGGAGDPADRG
jgi:hypothetical protein